mmetsp:Transcript_14715/g.41435  ORF Transcript_14715/g.41435 Transcript_14715/m.41435 type:complete len:281 (-) Transcript_14715:401-1243(-)
MAPSVGLALRKVALSPLRPSNGRSPVHRPVRSAAHPAATGQWQRAQRSMAASEGVAAEAADTVTADANLLPSLTVFDLDACLWDKEMYELRELVDPANPVIGPIGGAGEGVIGARSGREVIRLHPGAMLALQRIHAGHYPGMRAAAASSADTPLAVRIGRSALDLLEVVPGVTVRQVLAMGWPKGFEGNLQIGRQPPLSSNKAATHFPRLRTLTGIPYDRMLFFDDCNWGDHCAAVASGCVEEASGLGPVTVRTPRGLMPADWETGLKKYADRRRQQVAQ